MNDAAIENSLINSMAGFGFGGLLLLGFCFVFPIAAAVHSLLSKSQASGEKLAWVTFIIFSWPFLMLGSFIYAGVKYKRFYKAIPFAIAVIVIALFVIGFGNIINASYHMVSNKIEEHVTNTDYKSELSSRIAILRQESDVSQSVLNVALLSHLLDLSKNDLSQEEYDHWISLYNQRDVLVNEDMNVLERELREDAVRLGNSIDGNE